MEVIGYIAVHALSALGLVLIGITLFPALISIFQTNVYRNKRKVDISRVDIDERAKLQSKRNEILREKQAELDDAKLNTKLLTVERNIQIEQDKAADMIEESQEVANADEEKFFNKD